MQRRTFLASSAASAFAVNASPGYLLGNQGTGAEKRREYYELRRYQMRNGPQAKLAHDYFREALMPALNRLGISPVGVFNVEIGPDSPSFYVLIPSASIETLVTVESRLNRDADYLKAGSAFLNAPAQQAAYVRRESSLMVAFEGKPRLLVPPATAEHRSRMFELRTYESPTDQDHVRKVEMFNSGEFYVFEKAGFWQVFYGDTLIGPRLPNLTYMVCVDDIGEVDAKWVAFRSSPEWKKLSSNPRFNFDPTVTNVSNLIVSALDCSQV